MARKPPRRDRKGRFNKRGHFISQNGRLVRVVFVRRRASGPAGTTAAPGPAPATAAAGSAPDSAGLVEAPSAAPPTREPPRVPAPRTRLEQTDRAGATYTTFFKAMGTSGDLRVIEGAPKGKSPDVFRETLEDLGAPGAFYSNQSGLLGRVKWEGIVPLETLFDELNLKLQFIGEETAGFDFRLAYREWSYKYQVIETLGPTDRIILEIADRQG